MIELEPPRTFPRGAMTSRLWHSGCGIGLVAPIVAAIAEQPAEAERNMQPRVQVAGARLQQQHAVPARRRQPIGQNAAGAAGPHDDEVEGF